MKKNLIIVTCFLFLVSCIFESNNEPFSFQVTVKDTEGNPVEGLNLTLINNSGIIGDEWQKSESRAQTFIIYNLGIECSVDIQIYDLNQNIVRNLLSADLEAGIYTVFWNGKNDNGNPVTSGLYYCRLSAINDSELFYQSQHPMYLSSFSDSHKNGITNSDGIFKSLDKKPFINLFNVDSLQIVDEDGNSFGKEAFSDTTIIYLFEDGSTDLYQMKYVKVRNKKNEFEIIWDPDRVLPIRTKLAKHISVLHPKGADDIEIPSDDAELIGNYPNPFN